MKGLSVAAIFALATGVTANSNTSYLSDGYRMWDSIFARWIELMRGNSQPRNCQ